MNESQVSRAVTVEGARLRFAASHMATLGDDLEPLHGHNYIARCRVDGALTADRWVIDFSALKRAVRDACEALDHRFLLQRDSRLLDIVEDADGWTIRFGDREYRFPASDVVALPIENSTAELLAEWVARRVLASLAAGDHATSRASTWRSRRCQDRAAATPATSSRTGRRPSARSTSEPGSGYSAKTSLTGHVKPGNASSPSSASSSPRVATASPGRWTSTVRVSGCTTHTRRTP